VPDYLASWVWIGPVSEFDRTRQRASLDRCF
jgi:hypothetical protein